LQNGESTKGEARIDAIDQSIDGCEPLTQPPTADLSELQIDTTDVNSSQPQLPLPSQDESTITSPSTAPFPTKPDTSLLQLLSLANSSSGKLTNLLAHHFPSAFSDTATFSSRPVRLLKRAQIFVADLWAALEGKGAGRFDDIGDPRTGLTMFADYRVPQILCNLGVLSYSPPLNNCVRDGKMIESGCSWEVQLRYVQILPVASRYEVPRLGLQL
jgi:hypothetical protein